MTTLYVFRTAEAPSLTVGPGLRGDDATTVQFVPGPDGAGYAEISSDDPNLARKLAWITSARNLYRIEAVEADSRPTPDATLCDMEWCPVGMDQRAGRVPHVAAPHDAPRPGRRPPQAPRERDHERPGVCPMSPQPFDRHQLGRYLEAKLAGREPEPIPGPAPTQTLADVARNAIRASDQEEGTPNDTTSRRAFLSLGVSGREALADENNPNHEAAAELYAKLAELERRKDRSA